MVIEWFGFDTEWFGFDTEWFGFDTEWFGFCYTNVVLYRNVNAVIHMGGADRKSVV